MKLLYIFLLFLTTLFSSDKCLGKGHFFEYKMKSVNQALDSYLKGLKDNNVSCMIEAARVYSNEEYKTIYDKQKGFELLQKALKIEPFNSLIHYNLGTYYFNFNTKEQDINARYHFVLALFLKDKDAQEYINQLHNSNSSLKHIADVVENKSFNIILVHSRLINFFKDNYKLIKKDEGQIALKSKNGFKYTLLKDKVEISSTLDKYNALNFGNEIRRLQYSLYVDLPLGIENQSGKAIDRLISKQIENKNFEYNEKFEDETFKHQFSISNYNTVFFKYSIEFK